MKPKVLAYLIQCACFRCRKSFKRSIATWESAPPCPDCGSATQVMGRYFRAPAVRATKQWRKVETLYRAGIRFSGTQSGELGHFPETLLEARAFLLRNRAILTARQLRPEHARSRAHQAEKRRAEERERLAQRRKNQQARRIRLSKLR